MRNPLNGPKCCPNSASSFHLRHDFADATDGARLCWNSHHPHICGIHGGGDRRITDGRIERRLRMPDAAGAGARGPRSRCGRKEACEYALHCDSEISGLEARVLGGGWSESESLSVLSEAALREISAEPLHEDGYIETHYGSSSPRVVWDASGNRSCTLCKSAPTTVCIVSWARPHKTLERRDYVPVPEILDELTGSWRIQTLSITSLGRIRRADAAQRHWRTNPKIAGHSPWRF